MNCALIVGQGCGGTSAVAGVVHKLGVPMFAPGHSYDHPATGAGLYEDECLYGLFHNMTPNAVEAIKEVITTHRREWYGFKNTLLGQALPWVVPLFEDTVYVVAVYRTLMSCARGRAAGRCGLMMGKTYSMDEAVEWAIEAQMGLLRGIQTVQNWGVPVHHLSFEHLISDPESNIQGIADFLQLPVTDEALAHVKPKLVHY